MQHEIILLVADAIAENANTALSLWLLSDSARLLNAAYVKHSVYNALGLSALPVPFLS